MSEMLAKGRPAWTWGWTGNRRIWAEVYSVQVDCAKKIGWTSWRTEKDELIAR